MLVRTLAAGTALLIVASCRAPLPPEAASPTRAPELAASAEAFTPSERPPASDPGETSAPATPGTAANDPPERPPTEAAPRPSPEAPTTEQPEAEEPGDRPSSFRVVGTIDDPARDQGLEGPGYADIRRITVEDDRRRVRVRVEVGSDLPLPPEDGEVIGLGVDLLENEEGESVYQLFADGGGDGWLAYLQTPRGFVEYPGEFRVGGNVVEFVIPWEAIGSPTRGSFSGFLDWSRRRPVANAVANDRAPDSGNGSFER